MDRYHCEIGIGFTVDNVPGKDKAEVFRRLKRMFKEDYNIILSPKELHKLSKIKEPK